ncbi:MAG TPA: sterol desaturase family protein [Candidatus Binataceae bacterium]|jgi:sterol desaturase/sphingolipid hydroxylase (fatty acid hydroxylase superfamily)|nr:sterol desaturase family protein [Candidatus Binataceae bacterium]
MAADLLLLGAGLLAWTFLEYAIHGWMSHRFFTFATPLHQVHHHDPAAVFAVGAWLPTAAVFSALLIGFGMTPAIAFICGLIGGFVIYEAVHYRLHFASPANHYEERLRTRHLAHHLAMNDRCLGVTSALWDRVFGTEPRPHEMAAVAALLDAVEPIAGRSNLGRIIETSFSELKSHVSPSCRAK